MNITYRIVTDEQYFRATMERYWRQRSLLLRPAVQFLLLPLTGVVALLATWRVAPQFHAMFVGIFGVGVGFSLVGFLLTRHVIFRRFRAVPSFGKQSVYTLSEDGIRIASCLGESSIKWAVYPNSVRFADGIMLIRRRVICWLPDKALEGSTPDQATSVVEAKTALRHVT